MAKFINPGEGINLGEFGYSQKMRVITVHEITKEWLEERKFGRAQAEALLEAKAWHVFCAEEENGTGLIDDIYMHADDAQHFAVGDEIVYHYKRDRIPSTGTLAYIEREPKELSLTPA